MICDKKAPAGKAGAALQKSLSGRKVGKSYQNRKFTSMENFLLPLPLVGSEQNTTRFLNIYLDLNTGLLMSFVVDAGEVQL